MSRSTFLIKNKAFRVVKPRQKAGTHKLKLDRRLVFQLPIALLILSCQCKKGEAGSLSLVRQSIQIMEAKFTLAQGEVF